MADHPPELLPGVAQVSFQGVYGASSWANVMHFVLEEASEPSPTDINNLADFLVTKYAAHFHHDYVVKTNHFTTTKLVYRCISDPTRVMRTTRVGDVQGNDDNEGAPAQVAYLINWSTSDGRRGGKPRNYISGVRMDQVLNDTDISGAAASSLTTHANTFLSDIAGHVVGPLTIGALVNYSKRNANTWRDTAFVYSIFDGSCSPYLATQRDRVDRRRG